MALSPNTAWELAAGSAGASDNNGGGFVAGATGNDKTYGTFLAAVARSDLVLSQLAAPSAPAAPTNNTTGGLIAAGVYYFVQTYIIVVNGVTTETTASAASASVTTTGTTSSLVFASPAASAPAFATGYKLYGGTSSGGPFYLMNGTGGTAIGSPYTQTAAIPSAGSNPPGSNGTAQVVTSAGAAFDSTDPGNLINITGGTGWTTGRKQVCRVDGSGNALLDSSPGASGITGGSGTLGGPLATYNAAKPLVIGSNQLFVRYNATPYTASGTGTIGTGVIPGNGAGGTAPPTRVRGYYQSRGDIYPTANGQYNNAAFMPQINASGSAAIIVNFNNGGEVENLILNGATGTGASIGAQTGLYGTVRNVVAKSFGLYGIALGQNSLATDCEVTGTAASGNGINVQPGSIVDTCHIHDNICAGIYAGSGNADVLDSIIVRNTGAVSDGIQAGPNMAIKRNLVAYNGRDGISVAGNTNYARIYKNNTLAYNTRYGFLGGLAPGIAAGLGADGNAYIGNGVAARFNADDTTTNPINGVAPYTNRLDVTLAANPFLADTGTTSTSNFGPNGTAGGGAALKGAGYPQAWQLNGGTNGVAPTTSAPNIGPVQSATGGGGGISKGRAIGGI